jgi:hypothetical protein
MKRTHNKKLTIKNNKKRNTYKKRRTMRRKKLGGDNNIKNYMPSPPSHKPVPRVNRSNARKPVPRVNLSNAKQLKIDKFVNNELAKLKPNDDAYRVFKNATIAASLPVIKKKN